jgi:DNA-binding NarL/FixJ family response regulator
MTDETVAASRTGTSVSPPVRVFILDDHALLRRGLRRVLTSSGAITVVGESGSAAEALQLIPSLHPEVALLDVRLPDGSGIDVCRRLGVTAPDIRALIITTFDEPEARAAAAAAGAWAFVTKEIDGGDLVRTVHRVAAGERPLSSF